MNDSIGTTTLFSPTITLLERLLDLRMERHTLIAGNLANADTPRYRAMDIAFEDSLRTALARDGLAAPLRTHLRHLSAFGQDRLAATPTLVPRKSASVGNDLNTVDMDTEMTQLVQNQLLYNATAQLLSKKLGSLRLAIDGGR